MRSSRTLILCALLGALWPVWGWLFTRMSDGSGASWESVALLTAGAVLVRDRHGQRGSTDSLAIPLVLLLSYVSAFAFAPPLARALLAMAALGSACSVCWYGTRCNFALCGLFAISLPLTASLNFYLGYPLRVAVGEATQLLLQMNGIAAVRDGTLLLWNERSIAIDAPCSGIKMLWTGGYLCFALAAVLRLNTSRTVLLALGACVVVVVANVLRATSLFYVESGLIQAGASTHGLVGAVMFAFAAVAIWMLAQRLSPTCIESSAP
jgi:exosortase/archaeosortase family protein